MYVYKLIRPAFPYRHLPETPLHDGLREVKGKVDGFTERMGETMIDECSCANGKSRG